MHHAKRKSIRPGDTVQQIADFGKDEPWGASGLAVNTAGAAGVPAGGAYAVSRNSQRVPRYTPTGEFREAWGWGVADSCAAKKSQARPGPRGTHR